MCWRESVIGYRVGHTPSSVSRSFFEQNANATLPDVTQVLYVFHFSPGATKAAYYVSTPEGHSAYDEWSPAMYRGFAGRMELRNGYEARWIPIGATCLFVLCDPTQVPEHVLKRKDVRKILYAFESPNIRHTKQYRSDWLVRFDVVLSYWKDLLDLLPNAEFCPQVCRCLDFDLACDRKLLMSAKDDASVGIVLENRSFHGMYHINGVALRVLDTHRARLATGLSHEGFRVVGYGPSWKNVPFVEYGDTGQYPRSRGYSVMLSRHHTFALIVENTDARGYVSEKLWDALVAGCIPIYYGNLEHSGFYIPDDIWIDARQDIPKIAERMRTMVDRLSEVRARLFAVREGLINQTHGHVLYACVRRVLGQPGDMNDNLHDISLDEVLLFHTYVSKSHVRIKVGDVPCVDEQRRELCRFNRAFGRSATLADLEGKLSGEYLTFRVRELAEFIPYLSQGSPGVSLRILSALSSL